MHMQMHARQSISTQALAADWSDEASTLLYDVPSRSGPRRPVTILPPQAQPERPVQAGARLSHHQIVLTAVAATIGAMAAAWSIQNDVRAAAPAPRAAATAAAPAAPKPMVAAAVTTREPAAQPAHAQAATPERAAAASAAARPQAVAPTAATAGAKNAHAPAARAKPAEREREPRAAKVATPPAPKRAARERPQPAATAKTPKAKPIRAEAARPAAQQATARTGTGTLRINSRPWSRVYVDDRFVGNTPQMALALPAGRHRVALVSDEFDLKRTLTIDVKPGQTVTRTVELIQ